MKWVVYFNLVYIFEEDPATIFIAVILYLKAFLYLAIILCSDAGDLVDAVVPFMGESITDGTLAKFLKSMSYQ